MVLILGTITMVFLGWEGFQTFSVATFLTSYFCPIYFVLLYISWKLLKRTKAPSPLDADISSGEKDIDDECAIWESSGIEESHRVRLAGMSFLRRCFERLW